MADVQDVDTTGDTSTHSDLHYQIVSSKVPQWLLKATPQQRQALRATSPRAMPWLPGAAARLPEVVAALREEDERHQRHASSVGAALQTLPGAEAFAEPLLRQAIKDTFGLDLDVRRTFLFNAARARIAEDHLQSVDPVVRAFQVVKAATRSLLQSALQNFEAFEAEAGGMQDGRRAAKIFLSDTGQPLEPGRDIDLVPERFAALCRTLDLGGRYQRLIRATFAPPPKAQESNEAAAANRQAFFKLFEQSTFRLNLHFAYLRSWIDEAWYHDLLEVAKNGKARVGVGRASLKLWEVRLNGIVVFFRVQPADGSPRDLVVYMPDEPQRPFQAFSSIQAFHGSLCERLRDASWRNYFLRFVPAREREHLLQRIHRTLNPKVWNPGGWYEEQFDEKAVLGLSKEDFAEPLFDCLLRRKMAVLKDDGLFHAVTTAAEDHKSAVDKIDYFLGVAFNVANVAAFVVPGLGLVMLAVNAALLGYEVYEGFDSLAKGEREEAWGYFMDVGENLAIMAALGLVGAAAPRFEGNLPLAVRSMRPVTLADGRVRLWKPDLTPFAYDIRLPADLTPGENGLYSWQGRQWLALDGHYYSVRTLLGAEQGYRLEHPTRPGAYEPSVRHNGNGGWLHELDTPEQWQGLELFQRQGYREAGVSADAARRALRISGISEAQLRQTLVTCRRPPALLTDTLRRMTLMEGLEHADGFDAKAFEAGYRALQPRLSEPGQVLQRQFDLPNGLIEEIIAAATGAELAELSAVGKVPLRLAEEARIYQQQLRIARACEGLYLDGEANPDTARLSLHGLTDLPDWPAQVRIGLYDGAPEGALLTRIGSGEAEEVAVAWTGERPDDFCQRLFQAIPLDTRTRLELGDAATLRTKLQAQPLAPRQRLREWLGMQPVKPAFRSPMRLADGRVGYPLSGRGGPFFTEDQLLDKLRMLELDDVYVEDALHALYSRGLDRATINERLDRLLGEMLVLRQHLDRWVLESSRERLSERRQRSRERIGHGLWDYWRRGLLPELGRPAPRLILWQVQLADIPMDLPAFFRERVRDVLLDDVIQQEGDSYPQTIGKSDVQALARQFPNLTVLDIRSGAWGAGLTQSIVESWPRLMTLGLRELNVMLGHRDLSGLAGLARLRRLSLRGSRLAEMPSTTLHGLTLDYLGLDALDLQQWPVWLDSTALMRIGEVSLSGNNLSEVPPVILGDVTPVARPMRIALEDNPLGHQALLDLLLAEHLHRRFTFGLNLSPALEDLLMQRVGERSSLQATLQLWAEPEPLGEPLAPEHLEYRQRIARLLLTFWREDLRGSGMALLALDDLVLNDFPSFLPPFFAERVRRLDLTRFHAGPDAGSLERFVRRFPQLRELSLISGQPALESVPAFLANFVHLRELALVRMGMTIDQAAMEAFARMPVLSSLQLDGNRLGEITDMSMFNQRYLGFLGLSQMGIETWPAWLDPMLPNGIELLCLDDNQLTGLPARLLENHRLETGATEISLHNNPLPRETLIEAFTSQHYDRPYTFALDLPDDIAAMERQPHSSDSAGESSELSDEDPLITWETGDAQQDQQNQLLWDGLATRGNADALLGLVARLRYSADYRTPATRGELVQRVWSVLSAAMQDPELGQLLNGMAEEPLQQIDSHDTCPDGVRLEFNQMELRVYTRQALREIPEANRGPALFRLMRGNFRAQALDRIARRHSNGRDEAEVRLAYRLRWAAELQLPVPPRGMLYRTTAQLAPGELDLAVTLLHLEESGAGLLTFAAQCDFWSAYLRETFAERFKALKETYEAAVLSATDSHGDEAAEQFSARIRALEDKFKQDEQTLLQQLTLEQMAPPS
ncbi:NEL-type E3 ubiquitin ligase domain-containing protein [Pseudomonas wadenswilerensis]